MGLSLLVATIVTQIADGGPQSTNDLGNQTEVGNLAERLELARTIIQQGELERMEKEAAPLLRRIAFTIDDQPKQGFQAWLLLDEIHKRIRDEFLSLTGQKIDALAGSAVGSALIKQGKKDLGVDMLIREAWLLRSPAQLHLELLYTYHVEGFQRHDTRILKFYEETSAEGIPRSQFFMGKILLNGWGVPRDKDRAIELLRAFGLGKAFMELATYYLGEGDLVETEKYLEQAGTEGIPKAHYNLGVLAQERGDYSKAISRFEKTLEIDSEYVEARLELARMYVEGWGVERNEKFGFEMMKQVADTASGRAAAVAQMNVSNFYLNGIGTDRNLGLARQYYQKSFDGGYQDAEKALSQLDEIRSN
jgi:TPR repeat protein